MRIAEVRACRLCEAHLPLGVKPILQWHADARILIAGQAPGWRAHESGIPFNDISGKRLRDWLGVDAETFYDPRCFAILPMGFCFPGSGKSGDLPPRPECAEQWRGRLLARLKKLELSIILGQHAAAWHFPDERAARLSDLVERWEQYWPHIVALPHPSPRNQRWLREHPWFAEKVLPRLRQRVREVLIFKSPLKHS